MSVRVIVSNGDGSVEAYCEETRHSGHVPAANITHPKNQDGTDNLNLIRLPCPDGCGVASYLPAGGGSAPLDVQRMFVQKAMRDGGIDEATAMERIKERILATEPEGLARWRL